MLLKGIIPIVITPFDAQGKVDEASLRRVVRFELDGGVDGIGVGGFASEAYKLSEAERMRCAEIVADEVGGRVPLIIGMAANSTELAIEQAGFYAGLQPAALMVLPPCIMKLDEAVLVDHYVTLSEAVEAPLMVQVSPQIQAYAGVTLSVDALVSIAERAPGVQYFKIEGPGSAERVAVLHARLGERIGLFGGVGGLGLREEFQAGARGLLPGCGFNEVFVQAWDAWRAGDATGMDTILSEAQPLVQAVSGRGHEFSLHARKHLLCNAGIISTTVVRRPTVDASSDDLDVVTQAARARSLRINEKLNTI
jgi:4-hydroxy-tetrahydrodipicolinate synthase